LSARRFWKLYFAFYCVAMALCLLYGLGRIHILRGLPSHLAMVSLWMGMMIEGWWASRPKETDTRWLSGLALAGAMHPFPLMLAMAGQFSHWFVLPALGLSAYMVSRLVVLRLCLRPATSADATSE
jgi:hypothetical protein